ncbi:hypothetical protein AB0K02_18390 [Streptomyces sp. NPDC049597]|uniref:hypothetical protein n=1 Tax=Streptomyces sp. NPDC049597 TaxID=3155276 RepID=UPI003426309B
MDSEGHGSHRVPSRSQDEPVCPACGRPVGTVVKRHKTLGAFVPVWEPGPCRNPDCPLNVDKDGGASGEGPSGEEVGQT